MPVHKHCRQSISPVVLLPDRQKVTPNSNKRSSNYDLDGVGLEYEYAAGYDPPALVRIFERLVTEKHRSTLARAFASHPMTAGRLRQAQEDIATLLPARTAYKVDTSAFQEVKSGLTSIMHDHAPPQGGRPVLHRRTRGE